MADEFKCSLVGGDTTSGALSISITMLGEVPSGSAITRGGANDGDFIYVSGALGDGAAALSVIQGNKNNKPIESERLLKRFYRPEPKIEFGIKLRDVASACIDISDGLVADLGFDNWFPVTFRYKLFRILRLSYSTDCFI